MSLIHFYPLLMSSETTKKWKIINILRKNSGKIAYLILHCSFHVWSLVNDFKKSNKIKQQNFSQILQTCFGKFVKIKRLKVYGQCFSFKKYNNCCWKRSVLKKLWSHRQSNALEMQTSPHSHEKQCPH